MSANGLIASRVDQSGKAGVLVEMNSETDFVSRNEMFHKLLAKVARVAAGLPSAGASQSFAADAITAAALDGSTVSDAVTKLVSGVRENVVIRRGVSLLASANKAGSLIGAYTHNPTAKLDGEDRVPVAMGRVAALVAIDADEAHDELKKLAYKV